MISVLTLTYQRHHLLEEAIYSFLLQNCEDCEMVIINDSENCEYYYDHPRVKIHNLKTRFSSIAKKLEWGYKQCVNDYIFRLDDDDLLSFDGLNIIKNVINNYPSYDIYRSINTHYFVHNKYEGLTENVNTGNVYSKNYLDRIVFPDVSFGEDAKITFENNGRIFHFNNQPTMIYRWGMGTYHISGLGEVSNKYMYNKIDSMTVSNVGNFVLNPHFGSDYYKLITYN